MSSSLARYGWSPEFWKQPVQTTEGPARTERTTELRGLPGHYHFGGSLSPWSGYSEFGSGRQISNSYGFYVHGDQMVYQERPGSDEGLTLWAASGLLPAAQHLDHPVPGERWSNLHRAFAGATSRPDNRWLDLREASAATTRGRSRMQATAILITRWCSKELTEFS